MPIIIRNRNVIPSQDFETVSILGLEVPLTTSIPFGGQVELMDAHAKFADGQMGNMEFLSRLFCIFTRRLQRQEWVRYDWLSQQDLTADEIAEIMSGTSALMTHLNAEREKAAVTPKKASGKTKAVASSIPSE